MGKTFDRPGTMRINKLSMPDAGRSALTAGIICWLLIILTFPPAASAEVSPLTPLVDKTLSFFKPMAGDVVSVDDGVVRVSLGSRDGIVKGMRLRVLRKGEFFYHPVTQEPIGRAEKPVGTVEVLQVEEGKSSCKIIEGDAKRGDIVRVSASKKRLLFYQEAPVDYYLGDAYYKGLKATGRFGIIDAPVGPLDTEALLKVAASEHADLVLDLDSEKTGEKTYLKQTLLWPDGSILSEDSLYVPPAFLSELRFGSELLSDVRNDPLLSYDLPFAAGLISAGDIDGNGKTDLVISGGEKIYVYDMEMDLLYRLKMTPSWTVIWMDTFDVDSDGKDELFLSAISPDHEAVNSFIYKLEDRQFKTLWKTDGFIRVSDGRILYQKYSNPEGYSGPILLVSHQEGFGVGGLYSGLKGLDIYDFVTLKDREGGTVYFSMGDDDHLELRGSDGVAIWRSDEDMGGFIRTMYDGVVWHLNDRMVKRDNEVVVIKRNPLIGKVLGYKSSRLLTYRYSGNGVDESTLVDKISGKLLDYSIFDGKAAVLSKPLLGIKPGNILKGETPVVTILRIYSIKGR